FNSHANTEKRRVHVLELDLRGFSESQIADKLDVAQQTVSHDLTFVREHEVQLRETSTLHTFQRSYAMWCNLLQYCWQMSEKTKKITEQRKIGEMICEVLHKMDERFLPTSTLQTRGTSNTNMMNQANEESEAIRRQKLEARLIRSLPEDKRKVITEHYAQLAKMEDEEIAKSKQSGTG